MHPGKFHYRHIKLKRILKVTESKLRNNNTTARSGTIVQSNSLLLHHMRAYELYNNLKLIIFD